MTQPHPVRPLAPTGDLSLCFFRLIRNQNCLSELRQFSRWMLAFYENRKIPVIAVRSRPDILLVMTPPIDEEPVRLSEAAEQAGVTVSQLQYYLYMGVVQASMLSGGRQRLFDRRAIQRVRMVHLLNRSGYPLREIREIFMESHPD